MQNGLFDREAAEIRGRLTPGPRLAVIGSTSFHHPESAATCAALGHSLAAIDGLILLTGGVGGAGETVGRSFHGARSARGLDNRVFHVLPHGGRPWDYGTTLFAGAHMGERREILGRLAGLYVAIEGGPGTAHEATVALAHNAVVVPVGRSGGHAGDLYPRTTRPSFARDADWATLADPRARPEQVVEAVTAVVRAFLREGTS